MTSEAVVHSDVEPSRFDTPRSAPPWFGVLVDGARNPFAPTSVAETLHMVVRLARRTFGADGAAILLVDDGAATSAAASGAQSRQADALQVDHHQGPGFDAVNGRQPVFSIELRFDSRWRFWAPQAADLGHRSVLSLALADGERDAYGAVTLYSHRPAFFGTALLAPGLEFAQQASLAIAVAVEREQVLNAADTRGVIGQAQGILMERYQISADEALAMIRRFSSTVNQRMRLVAERIIGGRSLPDIELVALPRLSRATSIGSGFGHD